MADWRVTWYTYAMDQESYVRDWLAAADGAGFLPFEVVEPAPTGSSLAGFGGGSNGRLHLEIAHMIDGNEVGVSTSMGEARDASSDLEIRQTILSSVESVLDGGVTLPFTLHLTFEELMVEILVDGVPVTFLGVVGSGLDGWRLHAEVGHGTAVSLQGCAGSRAPTALRRRTDLRIDGLATGS